MHRRDTLVEVAKLTHRLCKLRLDFLTTLRSARDLLLHPNDGKATANSDRDQRDDKKEDTASGLLGYVIHGAVGLVV